MQNTENSLPAPIPMNLLHRVDFLIELILIFILSLTPFLLGAVGAFGITIVELGVLSILFLWVIKSIAHGSIDLAALPINKFIILFLLFILLQYLFINFFIYEFPLGEVYRQKIKKEALRFIFYLVSFYIVLNKFQERRRINRLLSSLIVIGFILSFFGIIQKLSGAKNIFWMNPPQEGGNFFASFPNRNHFANYINMAIFLALGAVFSQFPILRSEMQGLDTKGLFRALFVTFQKGLWLYMTALIVMTSSLFYSLSRGGIFSFICGLVFFSAMILLKGLTKRGYIFLFCLLLLTAALLVWIGAPGQIMKRFSEMDNTQPSLVDRILGGRKLFADKACELIRGYPLLGVGFGAFEFIYNKKYSPKTMYIDTYYYIDHLHNDFLELFCEVGLVGFVIFCMAGFMYLSSVLKMLLKRHDPFAVGVGIGAMAGLFSMCVHALFDFNFHITSNALLFFVIAGLGLVVSHSQVGDKKETTLLSKRGLSVFSRLSNKPLSYIAAACIFFYGAKTIMAPYIAYRISMGERPSVPYLKMAVRLDPLNDKYHFMLSRHFVEEAKADKGKAQGYIGVALREISEAARLNPWNEYYPVYADWMRKAFNP